jgi:Thiol-activated cytolysin
MKQHQQFACINTFLSAVLFSALGLLCSGKGMAQAKPVAKVAAKPVATTPAPAATASTTPPPKTVIPATAAVLDVAPAIRNMEEFRKSPAYAKRKAKYDNATPKPVVIIYPFKDDNSSLKITLDKNLPSGQLPGPPSTNTTGKTKTETSGLYSCTVTPVVLTANSNTFLNNDYSGSMANIVPGLCYTYANLTNGAWGQQTGSRYKIQLSCDQPNMSGKSYQYVSNPDQGNLQNGVNALFSRVPNTTGNESFAYQVSLDQTSAAYSLSIGAAASGYGVSLSNTYSTSSKSNHVHMTIDATKTMFSITTAPPDSGFFKDPNIEATPYLSFISEVQYGVRVLANADIAFSSDQEADAFKASYSGFGFSASLDVNYGSVTSNVQTTINSYIIGGPGGTSVCYSLKELKAQIEKVFANCTYKQARPIKYKASTMSGDVLNTSSITDNFEIRTCVPADGGSPTISSIMATVNQGSDGKEPHTGFIMLIQPGMNSGSPVDPEEAMYVAENAPMNEGYANNSTHTIIFRPGKKWKGKLDLATLEKAGGHLYISPIWYQAGSTSGINYDIWDITGISLTINLNPSPANPKPQSTGGQTDGKLLWNLGQQNQLVLDSRQTNSNTLYFDANLIAKGIKGSKTAVPIVGTAAS